MYRYISCIYIYISSLAPCQALSYTTGWRAFRPVVDEEMASIPSCFDCKSGISYMWPRAVFYERNQQIAIRVVGREPLLTSGTSR